MTVFSAHGVAPSVHAERQDRARCGRSTRPARWSPRCTSRRAASPPTATRSCWSATTATRRSRARWARRPTTSCSSRPSRTSTSSCSRIPRRSPTSRRRRCRSMRRAAIIERLRERFPAIVGPRTDDICYATTNRQAAVRKLATECELVLVIGSRNSSNSLRLVEVARDYGAQLAPDRQRRASSRRRGSRASARSASPPARARPRSSCRSSSSCSARAASSDISELTVTREDVRFMLPKTIRGVARLSGSGAHAGRLRPASRRRVRAATCCAATACSRRCSTRWRASIASCCSATRSSCATGPAHERARARAAVLRAAR